MIRVHLPTAFPIQDMSRFALTHIPHPERVNDFETPGVMRLVNKRV
jgi:hypothetical protein